MALPALRRAMEWLAGLAFLALLTMSPGPDTFLTLKQALGRGRDAALLTAMGISTGAIVHATLAGMGLSVLLLQWPALFTLVKFLGAGYLVYLGTRALRDAWRIWRLREPLPEPRQAPAAYREGLLTNLLNPKVAVFYVAFLPQFIGPGTPTLGAAVFFGLSHALIGLVWLSAIAFGAVQVRGWLQHPRRRAAVEALGGAVLVGFGGRLLRATPA